MIGLYTQCYSVFSAFKHFFQINDRIYHACLYKFKVRQCVCILTNTPLYAPIQMWNDSLSYNFSVSRLDIIMKQENLPFICIYFKAEFIDWYDRMFRNLSFQKVKIKVFHIKSNKLKRCTTRHIHKNMCIGACMYVRIFN